jgi:hypothetical protein
MGPLSALHVARWNLSHAAVFEDTQCNRVASGPLGRLSQVPLGLCLRAASGQAPHHAPQAVACIFQVLIKTTSSMWLRNKALGRGPLPSMHQQHLAGQGLQCTCLSCNADAH